MAADPFTTATVLGVPNSHVGERILRNGQPVDPGRRRVAGEAPRRVEQERSLCPDQGMVGDARVDVHAGEDAAEA